MKDRVRLLISDDHPIVRAGFEGILAGNPDFEVVGEAGNGREAVEMAKRSTRTSCSWTSGCRRWTASRP